MTDNLYEKDLRLWAEQQAKYLRERDLSLMDLDNVAEEIESLGRRQLYEQRVRIKALCTWMLLWELQPTLRRPLWYSNIVEERLMLETIMEVSPSLVASLPEVLEKEYAAASELVQNDTGLSHVPERCPWTFRELMQRPLDADRPLP